MSQVYDRVALIGLGLIASSIFWASKRNNISGHITGFARSEQTRNTARKIKLCDEVSDNLENTVTDADLIILCVPVGAMEQVMLEIAPFLKTGATISDVGSVKRAVIDAIEPYLPTDVKFVPAHPIAGKERSGFEASDSMLFDGKKVIITPQENNSSAVVDIHFWGRSLVFRRPPFALSRRLLLPPRRLFHRLWSLARSPTAIRARQLVPLSSGHTSRACHPLGCTEADAAPSARCERDAAPRFSWHG